MLLMVWATAAPPSLAVVAARPAALVTASTLLRGVAERVAQDGDGRVGLPHRRALGVGAARYLLDRGIERRHLLDDRGAVLALLAGAAGHLLDGAGNLRAGLADLLGGLRQLRRRRR